MLNMFSLGLISIAVGFTGSLIGLGGATILIPILVFFGIPVKEAIASAMVAIIATSSGSASSYVRERITNVKIAMYLEMFTISGAIIGATTTTIIAPTYLYFFFAAFLLTSFFKFRQSFGDGFTPSTTQDRVSRWLELKGSYFDERTQQAVEYKVNNAIMGGLGMLVAGFAAGMLGIGAGAFKVTVQENILRMPPKVSSTTSNFMIGMTALAGVSVYLFSGLLNLTLMAPMAVGATIGAMVGGRVLNRFSNRALSILFLVVVIFLIIQMLYKGVTSL
ncbi:MAG: sulfite exporter TauE/SafE family protein [Chloroflexota bacterium]|nr:sulfite exporter TauE/SafE family protein [Chloroflexota bacterium]